MSRLKPRQPRWWEKSLPPLQRRIEELEIFAKRVRNVSDNPFLRRDADKLLRKALEGE